MTGDEPAFPIPDVTHPNGQTQWGSNGMSYRQWLVGMIVARTGLGPDPINVTVDLCVRLADETIKQLGMKPQ